MEDPVQAILMYFVVPAWILAGLADWLCHRRSRIDATSGIHESLIHVLMFGEMGIPVLAGLVLEVNALVLAVMMVSFGLHELTAFWDVRYANTRRYVSPVEQRVHSYLELMPLVALSLLAAAHWDQFLSIFGGGAAIAEWRIQPKRIPLPGSYLILTAVGLLCFIIAPYADELLRCARAGKPSRQSHTERLAGPGKLGFKRNEP